MEILSQSYNFKKPLNHKISFGNNEMPPSNIKFGKTLSSDVVAFTQQLKSEAVQKVSFTGKKADEIKNVAIIGSGIMGSGIATAMMMKGYKVTLVDTDKTFLDKATGAINKNLGKAKEIAIKRQQPFEEPDTLMKNLTTTLNYEDIKSADLVIEAVPERMDIKKDVLSKINKSVGENTIIATNTSSLSVSELAKNVSNPERFVGMHFFNPANIMKLVEVIVGEKTSDEAVSETMKFAQDKLGKVPVKVQDTPGFIVNRLLLGRELNEAARMVDEGVATPAEIDTAFKAKTGNAMGPFATANLVGLDTCVSIMDVLKNGLGEDFEAAQVLRTMLKEGKLGNKTPDKGGFDVATPVTVSEDRATALYDRIFNSMFREAMIMAEEGVATSKDIDTAMKLGCAHLKGPFEIAQAKGV